MSRKKPTTPAEWERLVLDFVASLCLCDHMGDVSNDQDYVLRILGIEAEWDDQRELMDILHERGVTTLYGTSLERDDE